MIAVNQQGAVRQDVGSLATSFFPAVPLYGNLRNARLPNEGCLRPYSSLAVLQPREATSTPKRKPPTAQVSSETRTMVEKVQGLYPFQGVVRTSEGCDRFSRKEMRGLRYGWAAQVASPELLSAWQREAAGPSGALCVLPSTTASSQEDQVMAEGSAATSAPLSFQGPA